MASEPNSVRYRIEVEIGRGGMGRVYRGRDEHLGRTVALKMLPAEVRNSADLSRRLAQEARTASTLNHPGVATVYDFVEYAEGSYIVFEYVEGKTLRELLGTCRFTTEEIIAVGLQLADALGAAHDRGIIHRDLKPENIMLAAGPERPGRAKILDFGLAKLHRPLSTATTVGGYSAETLTVATAPGLLVGTVNYMAPEQLEGEPADSRSDLYALGLVLYEMATSRNPFLGRTPASTIANILNREPPQIAERNPVAPAELDRIVRKCLRRRPGERYQAARDLFVDLSNLRRDLESGSSRSVSARAATAPAAALTISRNAARALLTLIQVGYLAMYASSLYKMHDVLNASREMYSSETLGFLLTIDAFCGVAVRLYLLTAVGFDYADLGRKFRLLFPAVLVLDAVWASSPLLLIGQLRALILLCVAALAFLPFCQRTLLYAAYAPGGGPTPALEPAAFH